MLSNLIGCLNHTGITSENYRDNMFTYSEKFNTKKWFLTKHEELIDLNQIRYLKIEVEDEDGKEDRKFLVRADCFDILAICDTELEAKEYIKDIYNFLIAE